MRIPEKTAGLAVAVATAFSSACGGSATTGGAIVKNSDDGVVEALERRIENQERQIAELEVRLALLEASATEFRAVVGQRRPPRGETIRIGSRKVRKPTLEEDFVEEAQAADDGPPRPLLRLYGRPPEKSPAPSLALPPGISDRLPVAPLPERSPAASSLSPAAGQALRSGEAAIINEYREALSLLRSGRFDQALQAFSAFVTSYPEHAYADNALYWRAEALYAKKQYGDALRQFQEVTERYPASRKLPDSLLKIGLCHRRLGDADKARVYFRRVVRQYPDSTAARLASREDAS